MVCVCACVCTYVCMFVCVRVFVCHLKLVVMVFVVTVSLVSFVGFVCKTEVFFFSKTLYLFDCIFCFACLLLNPLYLLVSSCI